MDDRPNILFLIADDHRHDVLGVAGHRQIRTPNLDALAARGTRFVRHHCQGGMTGAICAPSRASILSGRELFDATASKVAGDHPGVDDVNPNVATLPETLRGNGYRTHAVGKWHSGRLAFHRSFDSGDALFFGGMSDHDAVPVHDFDPTGAYPAAAARTAVGFSTDVFADATVDFLRQVPQDRPFFCWTAFTAPHDPRTPPPEFAARYPVDEIELPVNFRTEPVATGDNYVRDEELAGFPRDPDEIGQHIADYYGMISHLDDRIGRILQVLDDTGLAQNTIVVYTADHGLALGQHGLMGKQNLFEHSIRVPLIMAGPGVGRQPSVVDALTLHADLFPTLAQLATTEVPDTVQGFDLGSLITGGNPPEQRATVHAAYLDLIRMASDGRHKLINYFGEQPRTELYDLEADPAELTDLADEIGQQEIRARLSGSLLRWQQDSGDPIIPPVP